MIFIDFHRALFFHRFALFAIEQFFSCGTASGRPLAHNPAHNQNLNFWARASQLPISLMFVDLDIFHRFYYIFTIFIILIVFYLFSISLTFHRFSIVFHSFSYDFH